jgi:epoxyqueuosine reductase
MNLKQKIKAGAESLGFVAIGFTHVELAPGMQRFKDWIENGQRAEMNYLASQRSLETRSDPRLLLPSCQTVISLLSSYPPPEDLPSAEMSKFKGRIAAYALQRDYHEVLRERLDQLAHLINELAQNDVETYPCVDSAPILEKGYAHKAGLGWIGRNSLLLRPKYGSWTFLSELLISLDLESDLPYEGDGCGDCQLCVKACPTQAILPDRSIDARHCLSYLTIENRGKIPEEFRKAVGNRIFGCDQCQSVCPVNKRGQKEDRASIIDGSPDLAQSFGLTEEEFKLKYRHTPVWRAKYSGFRRNVAIAMGNSGQKEFIPLLKEGLRNENDPIVADAIGWALEELGK